MSVLFFPISWILLVPVFVPLVPVRATLFLAVLGGVSMMDQVQQVRRVGVFARISEDPIKFPKIPGIFC